MKIILADDHKILRQTLAALLTKKGDFELVAEASNGKETITLVKELNPDLLVIDINMPEMDGFETIEEIMRFDKKIKFLILTMIDDIESRSKAMNLGVDGYLLKTSGTDDLLNAIYKISKQKFPIGTPSSFDILEEKESIASENKILTKREAEIISLIVQGKTSKEIGEILFISPFTVQKHRKNIMKKTNLKGTAEIVKYALSQKK